MLPKYQAAMHYREDCATKDKEILQLKRELQTAKDAPNQANGKGESNDSVHWRLKYDKLLHDPEDN